MGSLERLAAAIRPLSTHLNHPIDIWKPCWIGQQTVDITRCGVNHCRASEACQVAGSPVDSGDHYNHGGTTCVTCQGG